MFHSSVQSNLPWVPFSFPTLPVQQTHELVSKRLRVQPLPCHRVCHAINKLVYYQHLLLSFEELLSLRLSDPFALVAGWINNNWRNHEVVVGVENAFWQARPSSAKQVSLLYLQLKSWRRRRELAVHCFAHSSKMSFNLPVPPPWTGKTRWNSLMTILYLSSLMPLPSSTYRIVPEFEVFMADKTRA